MLGAFGASDPLERLVGGRGLTWRSGDVVLRPVDGDAEAEWKSELITRLAASEAFTVPRPIPAAGGGWVRESWQAIEWIPGAADERRVDDVVRAGAAFHEAITGAERPGFLDESTDAWSVADRIVWEEVTRPDDATLARLAGEYRAVDAPSQMVHGDLLGNVLFSEGRPPAIIDWAPYWRPTGYGAAIAVVDAACWHGLPLARLAEDHGYGQWRQLLLRALVFRIATLILLGHWDEAQIARHAPIVDAVIDGAR